MILTCPECASRYFVDDAKVAATGRAVRCAACGNRWTAYPEALLDLTPEVEDAVAAPEPPISELSGEELPRVFREKAVNSKRVREAAATGVIWAGMAGVLALVLAMAVVFRVEVVRMVPRSAGAYAAVGLPVNNVGLVIEQLRAEPSLQDGRAALTVSGVLRNIEDHEVIAPPLRVSLLNPAGKRVAGKIAAAADPHIPPGEARYFAIALLDPPSTAKDLEIGFVLDAGAAKAVKAAVAPAHKAAPADLHLRASTEAPAAQLGEAAPATEAAHAPEGETLEGQHAPAAPEHP